MQKIKDVVGHEIFILVTPCINIMANPSCVMLHKTSHHDHDFFGFNDTTLEITTNKNKENYGIALQKQHNMMKEKEKETSCYQ